jgi:hypothetical protein
MNLGDGGESRVRGYLFVFERSLRTFLPRDIAADAVREVESHIRDAVAQADGSPNERDALDRILDQLGPPVRVAQAYSLELVLDEAAATGRIAAVVRSLLRIAATGVTAFFTTLGLFVGYAVGAGSSRSQPSSRCFRATSASGHAAGSRSPSARSFRRPRASSWPAATGSCPSGSSPGEFCCS